MVVPTQVQQVQSPHKGDFIGALAKLWMGIGTSVATGNPMAALQALAGGASQQSGPQNVTPNPVPVQGSTAAAGPTGQVTSGQTAPGVPGSAAAPPPTSQGPTDASTGGSGASGPAQPQAGQMQSGSLGSNAAHMVAGALLANPNLLSQLLPQSGFGSGGGQMLDAGAIGSA